MSREECSPAIVLPRTNILDVEGGELARLTPRCARRGERKQRAHASPAMRSTAARRVDVPFGTPPTIRLAACVTLGSLLCKPQHSKHTSIIMNNYVYCSSLGIHWCRTRVRLAGFDVNSTRWAHRLAKYVSIGRDFSKGQSRYIKGDPLPIEVSRHQSRCTNGSIG